MNQSQLENLIVDLGVTKIKQRGNWLMGCCPIHGEREPSWGINLDVPHRSNCFSCGDQQITVAHLISKIKNIPLKRAREIVGDTTQGEFQLPRNKIIRRWEEERETRTTFDQTYIAPFRSGKETHEYFFERGFSVNTAKMFRIGFDRKRLRVTVPDFFSDGEIAGVIGRTVEKNVEPRYMFYDEYPKSALLFPEDKVNRKKRWFIIVEGTFDCMWMHQNGFDNTLAIKGSKISKAQADWLAIHADYVVSMLDNDNAGKEGEQRLIKFMKKRNVDVYTVEYPSNKNDPMELSKKRIRSMIKSKKSWYNKRIDRIS